MKKILIAWALLAPACMSAGVPVQSKSGPSGALAGRNIALWQSHGRYFDGDESRWKWQRCRLFGTVEDLYTRSYVVPFLVPMLENAGAYVMLPRERDANECELVIDPDGEYAVNGYAEHDGKRKWTDAAGAGFGLPTDMLFDGENPFEMGKARKVKTVQAKDADRRSEAKWSGAIPRAGEYAVYVSYPELKNPVPDVNYTVHTATGPREFTVNQTMGAGTWMYVGTFPFEASERRRVLVSMDNVSAHDGEVGADAVRIGGGMGNVARYLPGQEEYAQLSGMPRWAEASRYYLQWAGMPDSVYANQETDYRDDIFCRPQWVNYMMQEKKVPIDMVMAFHSDAGTTDDDSTTVGTLGIYYTARGGKYADGTSRRVSGKLCDAIVSSMVNDVRSLYDPDWTRRKMRDASYIEARVPEVPTMLLESMSHQNFADMKLGLDPQFKFDVSRAVYKGILRFLADRKLAQYIVQPLPPQGASLVRESNGRYRLSWQQTPDPLEPTANASAYIVERRNGIGEYSPFMAIDTVGATALTVDIPAGRIYSYRIVAVNAGGRSFPSEVLSAGYPADAKGHVTVVNGFTRVSGPDHFSEGTMAGFGLADPGVPMGTDLSFTGRQYDFNRSNEWVHDDQPGFGASRADMETVAVYGNSFDYTATHGAAIMSAGYGFDSRSRKAFAESADLPEALDLILGLQRTTEVGTRMAHQAFPPELRQRLDTLALYGVPMFVSGAYVATDVKGDSIGTDFIGRVLGVRWRTDKATSVGRVAEVRSPYGNAFSGGEFEFSTSLGDKPYCVPSADAIYNVSGSGAVIMRYGDNQAPAAVASAPAGRRCVTFGFPFEAVKTPAARNKLMKQILKFLKP